MTVEEFRKEIIPVIVQLANAGKMKWQHKDGFWWCRGRNIIENMQGCGKIITLDEIAVREAVIVCTPFDGYATENALINMWTDRVRHWEADV